MERRAARPRSYAERRRWEPLYETTQIKGDGETHPFLSPDDEFADYETWDVGNLDLSEAKTDDMLAGEYAREALKRGLQLEQRLGTNPYKFGHDRLDRQPHRSLATAEEDNFFGKHTGAEPSAGAAWSIRFMETERRHGILEGWQQVASGLAAVWAEENTPRRSSTPWSARRSTPPPARAWGCASSAAGISPKHDLHSRTCRRIRRLRQGRAHGRRPPAAPDGAAARRPSWSTP